MRLLCCIVYKISAGVQKLKTHIRSYYYSRIFKSCGRKIPKINRQVVFSQPRNIECGSGVTINPQCYFAGKGGIFLGDDVTVSAGAKILSSSLKVVDGVIQKRHIHKPVRIGKGTWIGAGAIICPGVTIGENSIIAAGAVVTKDMPSDSMVGGVPAKVIRSLKEGSSAGQTV